MSSIPDRITVEFVSHPNIAAIIAGFFTTRERLDQLVEPATEVMKLMVREIQMNFDAEGRPTPWEPLAESTARKRGSEHPILDDEGDLVQAATSEESWVVSPAGAGRAAEAHLDIYAVPYYGFFHITGLEFMPQRDWSFISDDALNEADDIVKRFVDDAMELIPSA